MASHVKNLLVIGPGHLGARVATLWQKRFPEAKILLKAQRNDVEREAKWKSLGFESYQPGGEDIYPNVVFSAPPPSSTSQDVGMRM